MTNSLGNIIHDLLAKRVDKYVSEQDVYYLAQETFSLEPYQLMLKKDELYEDTLIIDRFNKINEGKPLYYVLGYAPFFGRNFIVKEKVTLIPRNETEELVNYCIDSIKSIKPTILDIGTGTGCIAISLSKEINGSIVEASDISLEALEIAKKNATNLKADVHFILSDCLKDIINKYDLIVSNPPYIDIDTYVEESVDKYEPHIALYADNHGLAIYEEIFSKLDEHLNPAGIAAFEISPDLKIGLKKLLIQYLPTYQYQFIEDMNHFVRFLILKK